MKPLLPILFVLYALTGVGHVNNISEEERQYSIEQEWFHSTTDSTLAEFNEYLNFIFSQSPDSIVELDSAMRYAVRFVTSCPFVSWFQESNYLDSLQKICIKGISKSADTVQIISVNNGTQLESWLCTKLKSHSRACLTFFYCRSPVIYPSIAEPYVADSFDLIGFNNGRYVIKHERRFGLDIKGSMPPGVDVTYFMERIK